MLQVTPFMIYLYVITILFIVPAAVSLGIGPGAAYGESKLSGKMPDAPVFEGQTWF
jgi:hypothetical protein